MKAGVKNEVSSVLRPERISFRPVTVGYGDSFTFLYADDVCTSQRTHLWASTTCYGDSFTF
jgi:hypothetical protein